MLQTQMIWLKSCVSFVLITELLNAKDNVQSVLRGYSTPRPCFFFRQSILWIWSEMFQGTQKSQFYFRRDRCCEVMIKNMRKSILFMF